ncbi:MAG: prealbumin-like fold domain-containing protein [Pyrinomonadaceae bacterium]
MRVERRYLFFLIVLAMCLLCVVGSSQSSTAQQDAPARGVLRLRVRPKIGGEVKGLARKRFFLIKGSLEENRALIEKINQTPFTSRDCYYKQIGASDDLIKWLAESDCESVYCREVEPKFIEGAEAVREFHDAAQKGEKEYGSRELARRWLTTNLAEAVRDGYYKQQQAVISVLVKEAEATTKQSVLSVMTDRNGTAYFTDLEPGTYVITNLIPAEIKTSRTLWNCEVKVKAGDLATEKPFLISNQKEKNVKCVAVEQPLPACEKKS